MRKNAGFSLIELLIVVAIISIIMAIALPNFMTARRSAQASSMMADLRTVHSAQTAFFMGQGRGTYGDFPTLEAGNYLALGFSNAALTFRRSSYVGQLNLHSSNTRYNIQVTNPPISSYSPSYFIDESGTIRFNNSQPATANDQPIGSAVGS